ncbi:baseplate J/gp47 family protein [Halanaerobacter jeridensis]|uniref:Baseplate protein J-like barrel domain-containing protein n=1 Tax=Halanaerobacter jeridensis TaxID=706427 RepID=A0A939BRJ1_9FIRM|nr:baseplate J/gp47 family protein [Halanaerobacter jeridensis]MBM7556056.1 hypothetical protein [Halanaerobacter jeridensis]
MKEYSKIYIDPEESLKSFLEKLQGIDEEQIIIIIHQRSSIFIGQVNIELVRKYANRAEKELIFITNIKKVKNLLGGVGFEVYDNLEEFKTDKGVDEPKEDLLVSTKSEQNFKLKSKGNKLVKVFLFLIFSVILGAGYFYFTLPIVTIKVTPVIKDKKVVSNFIADLEEKEVNFRTQQLALIKKEIKLKTTTQVDATGEKSVGVEYATGVVTFINNTKEEIIIPAGTVIATRNGIKYKTLAQAVVPKIEVEKMMGVVVGAQAGKEEVNIRAINKGQTANVSSGRIVEFADKSYAVKLFNPEKTTGGKNKSLKQITAGDIKRALKKAKKELKQKANQELKKKFEAEMIYFAERLKLQGQRLQAQNEAGDLASKVIIHGETNAVAFAIRKSALKDLALADYNQQLGVEFKLYSDKIKIKDMQIKEITDEKLKIKVISTGEVVGTLKQVELIDEILGKKVANVKSLLDNMSEVANYKISPSNQVNLPQFKYGVKLIVVEPVKE